MPICVTLIYQWLQGVQRRCDEDWSTTSVEVMATLSFSVILKFRNGHGLALEPQELTRQANRRSSKLPFIHYDRFLRRQILHGKCSRRKALHHLFVPKKSWDRRKEQGLAFPAVQSS